MAPRMARGHFLFRSSLRNFRRPTKAGTTAVYVLVPIRTKARIDAAPILRQRRNRLAVVVVEFDLQRIEIGLLAFGARCLGYRGNTVLVEQPFQGYLRRARIVLAADPRKRLVGRHAALHQWA